MFLEQVINKKQTIYQKEKRERERERENIQYWKMKGKEQFKSKSAIVL